MEAHALNPRNEFYAVSAGGMGIVAVFQHRHCAKDWAAPKYDYFEIRKVTLPFVLTDGWLAQDGEIFNFMKP